MSKFNYYPFNEYKDLPEKKVDTYFGEDGTLKTSETDGPMPTAGLSEIDMPSMANQLMDNTPSTKDINQGALDTLPNDPVKGAGIGNKVMEAGTDILAAGMKQMANFSTTARTAGERKAQTMSSVMDGAKIGMAVGGPAGAAIGGAALGIVSAFDNAADKKEMARLGNQETRKGYADVKEDRAQFYDQQQVNKKKKQALGFTKRFNPNNNIT